MSSGFSCKYSKRGTKSATELLPSLDPSRKLRLLPTVHARVPCDMEQKHFHGSFQELNSSAMKSHRLMTPMLVGIVLLFVGCSVPAFAAWKSDGTELWERSLVALKSKSFAESSELISRWLRLAVEQGVLSREAHFNLALSQWGEKKADLCAINLLISSSLSQSPFHNWKVLHALEITQKKLGISEPITDQLLFRVSLLVPPNLILVLFLVGLWTTVGTLIFAFYRRDELSRLKLSCLLVVPVILLFSSAGLQLNRLAHKGIGVLSRSDSGVTLAETLTPGAKVISVNIPAGTLVAVDGKKGFYAHVSGPIAGWVPVENLLQPSPPESLL